MLLRDRNERSIVASQSHRRLARVLVRRTIMRKVMTGTLTCANVQASRIAQNVCMPCLMMCLSPLTFISLMSPSTRTSSSK